MITSNTVHNRLQLWIKQGVFEVLLTAQGQKVWQQVNGFGWILTGNEATAI